MNKINISINDHNFAHSIAEQLTHLVDFIQDDPEANLLYIANNKDHRAITGMVGTNKDMKTLLAGMLLTTVYDACNKSYLDVFKLLQELSHMIVDHFTDDEMEQFKKEILDRLESIEGGSDE